METSPSSRRVLGLYDKPFWDHFQQDGKLHLQCCNTCGRFRYPPSSVCPACLAEEAAWLPTKGTGTVLSWTIFHRQYLPEYPAPYNVIAVELDEGPIFVSNLADIDQVRASIGRRVSCVAELLNDGIYIPRFKLE